jgi:hypothetical protein
MLLSFDIHPVLAPTLLMDLSGVDAQKKPRHPLGADDMGVPARDGQRTSTAADNFDQSPSFLIGFSIIL